jgi:thioredoxin-like negative regulator of GroEL
LYPILDKLIHGLQGKLLMVNINTEEFGTPTRDYGVTSLPTLKLFRKRLVVETLHEYTRRYSQGKLNAIHHQSLSPIPFACGSI